MVRDIVPGDCTLSYIVICVSVSAVYGAVAYHIVELELELWSGL